MIEEMKRDYPGIYLYISTNGLLLNEEKIRRLAVSGDGRGHFFGRRCGSAKPTPVIATEAISPRSVENHGGAGQARNGAGSEMPFINWRYILFQWNDSFGQMSKTRRLARKIGVDRLTWEITDHPAGRPSGHTRGGRTAGSGSI